MLPRPRRSPWPAVMLARACFAMVTILTALVAAAPAPGATLAGEVARTGVWANTSANTPAVWGSGSSPCWSDVAVRTPAAWSPRLRRTPLPCDFAPAPGGDGEAIVTDQTGQAAFSYYELWSAVYNHSAFPWRWSQ